MKAKTGKVEVKKAPYNTKPIQTMVPLKMYADVYKLARANNTSMSDCVRGFIMEGFRKVKELKKAQKEKKQELSTVE